MKGKDQIQELFSKKLGNYEAKVNPQLWNNIASQVAAQSTTVAAGISVLTKIIIGTISAAVITGVVVYSLNSSENKQDKKTQTSELEKITGSEQKPSKTTQASDNEEIAETFLEVTDGATENNNALSNKETSNSIGGTVINNDEVLVEKIKKDEEPKGILKQRTSATNKDEKAISDGAASKDPIVSPITAPTAGATDPVDYELEQVKKTYSIEKLPNTFTPNNDGNNDYFLIKSEGLLEFNLVVLDANNKTVYQTSNPQFKWGGVGINGEQLPKGKYVYFITAIDSAGNPVNEYSILTIH
ncbi:MAG: gliding motility-associated C-terminal domain-containing protein [Fluviicola sp.]|nr:gliding motility-associated C-terminal domain-containing protein [Fluviicola sp.]